MFERLFQKLKRRFDPEGRVRLLRSSRDPELARYLDAVGAEASTDMDADGTICIKVHDLRNLSKGVWLEEMAHALQFLKQGNVPLSCGDQERHAREQEVSSCLNARAKRLNLQSGDLEHLKRASQAYGVKYVNH